MAESKFLKWQDIDNDGLIDICDDEIFERPSPCKGPCTPNPLAIISDWRKRTIDSPTLNEKFCLYQVTVVTPHKSTASSTTLSSGDEDEIKKELQSKYEENVDDVIDSLFTFYEKHDSAETRQFVREYIVYDKYDLDPRPNSRLKLLYSVPFDVMYEIPAATKEEEPEPDEPGEVEVTYNASQMITKMIRVRKGLDLYGRYLKVYRAINGGNLLFWEDNRLFNLEQYGDVALFSSSILSEMMTGLEAFLNQKGFQIPGVAGPGFSGLFAGFGQETVTMITFRWNNYKLKKMLVYTEECAEKPYHFGRKKLRPLTKLDAWKDVTANAYLAQLFKMEAGLSARVQIPWVEFVTQYTYPKIYSTIDEEADDESKTVASCIADALANEGKQLGQDILDEILSLSDVIAHKFNKNVCKVGFDGIRADEIDMGLQIDGEDVNKANIYGMAQMQAFKELEKSDNTFTMICAIVLASTTKFGPAASQLDKLWRHGFEPLKKCGLFDLLMDAIRCLMAGLTLEEAMASLIKSALNAMSIENFGDLFIGLPPEAQAELGEMAAKKLESGDIFVAGSTPQEVSNLIAGQGISKPWENQAIIDDERRRTKEGQFYGVPGAPTGAPSGKTRRTIGEQFDVAGQANKELNTDALMQAYIAALMEYYSENLVALLDELNKFPGAQIIASLIGMLDCPVAPLFNPSFWDFIKSLGNIFCGDISDIRLPRMENYAGWIPKLKDLTRLLWEAIKYAVKLLVLKILMLLFIKICELIGDAICKAIETMGAMAMAIPSVLSGKTTFAEVIKEAICGPDADDKKVEDTIVDIVAQLGAGGAAFANRSRTIQFAEDIANSVTRQEISDAFLGNPSAAMLEIADQLIEYEYPEFREALPNKNSLGTLFGNIGNLFPLDYRDQLRDIARGEPTPEELEQTGGEDPRTLPANPSICANTEELENFRKLRCEMLEGRASPEQCQEMYCNLREGFLHDLDDLGAIMQKGIPQYIEDNMPPLVSTPGCDDGLVPYESEQQIAVTSAALGNDFEQLEIDYIKDMLGNGGLFVGDDGWGFINMVMSDTQGNPLTAHHRKAWNNKSYVNFASNQPNGGEPATGFFSFLQPGAGFSSQHGQFPYYVGEWMMRQFLNAGESTKNPHYGKTSKGGKDLKDKLNFRATNGVMPEKRFRIDFDEFDFNPVMGTGVDLLRVPDMGYNTPLRADMSAEKIVVTRRARKGPTSRETGAHWQLDGADISLNFKDNAAGLRKGCGRGSNEGGESTWSWGFDLQCYFSDIIEEEGKYVNRFDDNLRVKIEEKMNFGAEIENPLCGNIGSEYEKDDAFDLPDWIENVPIVGWALQSLINLIMYPFSMIVKPSSVPGGGMELDDEILRAREFEFLAVDEGLNGFHAQPVKKLDLPVEPDLSLADYPQFARAMTVLNQQYPPQVALLADISGQTIATEYDNYNDYMTKLFKRFCKEIGENETGWKYGMDYDYLTKSDLYYVDPETGNPYDSISVTDVDLFGNEYTRGPSNDDMILGISYDQYLRGAENARAIYLDPSKFGGSYTNPPLYVKPLKYDGWMGFTQVLFPEYSPCKPRNQNLIDFEEIKGKIDQRYPLLQEDPRLKNNPDCAVEVPFNRIMNRPAKAGMMGLIDAAIRIYASTHIFKAIGVFSKIMPKFPDNFSNIFAAYIVEHMEEGFKDVQSAFWESFNPFKDDMFWYGFLEQSVQYYKFLVDEEQTVVPTPPIQEAMDIINDFQQEYGYPFREAYTMRYKDVETGKKKSKYVQSLWDAKLAGDAGFFQTLQGYRRDENFEAVQMLEEEAKLILTELVKIQLNVMGEKLVDNMAANGFVPDIFDLDYWLFMNLCPTAGDPLQIFDYKLVEQFRELYDPAPVDPDKPDVFYTSGGEWRIAQDNDPNNGFDFGDDYVGYFHSQVDEAGDKMFYTGEELHNPNDLNVDLLRPVAKSVDVGTIKRTVQRTDAKAIKDAGTEGSNKNVPGRERTGPQSPTGVAEEFMPIGDIPDLSEATPTTTNFFAIEKFISINGEQHKVGDALSIIMSNDHDLRISDVYPGTMKTVTNKDNEVVGIEGKMGVQYGINFYYGTSKVLVTTVSVDALDLLIGETQSFTGNSKLLFCLLNMLKNDAKYKVMTSYIFSMKKVTAILALYNDMGFLSSIGEVTVGPGDATRWVPTTSVPLLDEIFVDSSNIEDWIDVSDSPKHYGIRAKPGMIAYLHEVEGEITGRSPFWWPIFGETYTLDTITYDMKKSGTYGAEGWQEYYNRQPGFFGGLFVKEWDNWDRLLLRNSKARIKKMFRAYYNSRSWKPGDNYSEGAAKIFLRNMRARIMPSPGAGLLSWWQRRKLRSTPYDAKGNMCDGPG